MVLDARAYRYVNFTYALVDETGEVHPPKDANRNEITLTPQEMHEIRAQVLSDAAAFSQNDFPLSAAWLRQLGDEEKAQMTEAMVHNLTTAPPPPPGKRKPRSDHYQIEAIVEEQRGGFLVRWAGYHPSWEAWRISGAPGGAVETWEQGRFLENTEAMRTWRG